MSPGPLEEDLLRRHHSESAADILVDGIAKLGPVSALDGPFAQARLRELPHASDGGDFDLFTIFAELILNDLLDAVLVGADHLARRQQEVEILAVVLVEFSPQDLRRLRRS